MRQEGAEDIATVTVTLPPSSGALALFQHLSIKRSAGGEPLLPILWSDNDVTLWPGESLTLTATLLSAPGAAAPVVEVSGWNVPTSSVPVVESRTPRRLRARRGAEGYHPDTPFGAHSYNPQHQ